ncbi:MAG: hypothetical protein ACFB9M_18345 [Myxococcota bacterium]
MDEALLLQLVRSTALSPEQAEWAHTRSVQQGAPVARVLLDAALVSREALQIAMAEVKSQEQKAALEHARPTSRTAAEIMAGQERTARMLRTLFELCRERGLVLPEDFMRRVAALAELEEHSR